MAEKSAPPVSVTCETGESLGIQKANHFRCNQVQHKMSGGMTAICDFLTAGVVEVNFLQNLPRGFGPEVL